MNLAFALTFLLVRVLGYGLGLADMWAAFPLWQQSAEPPFCAVVFGIHAGYVLNLYWAKFVVSAAYRRLRATKEKDA